MLRLMFVFGCLAAGLWYARRGPFYVLLVYLWLAYFRPEHWVWGGGDLIKSLRLSLVVGTLLVIALLFSKERERLKFNGGIALLVAFLFQATVSRIFSPYPEFAGGTIEDLGKIILITCIMAGLAADKSRFRLVLLVMAVSLAFEGAKQGWANLILNPGGKNRNLLRGFGDENGVALAMFMLTPILIVLAQTASSKWERFAHRFLTIGVVNRGLSTYSRGGFLACGAMMFFYFSRSRHKLRTAIGIVAIAALLLPVMPDAFWERMGTIAPAMEFVASSENVEEEDVAGSARARLHVWAVAIAMAADRPLTGVGWQSYSRAYNDYDFSGGTYGENRSEHSVWFGVLGEVGYPGLILYVIIIGTAAWRCRRIRQAYRTHGLGRDIEQYAICLQTGLVVFVVGGSFLGYHYSEILWHFVGLTLALHAITEQEVAAATTARQSASPSARAVMPASSAAAVSRPDATPATIRTPASA